MGITPGWRFYSADFSVQAGERAVKTGGVVMLKRDPDGTAAWLRLPENVREDLFGPELFIRGRGTTLELAVEDANAKAKRAQILGRIDA